MKEEKESCLNKNQKKIASIKADVLKDVAITNNNTALINLSTNSKKNLFKNLQEKFF